MDSFDFFLRILEVTFVGGCIGLWVMWSPTLWKSINKATEERDRFRSRRNKR
jgi:hypothetical protein